MPTNFYRRLQLITLAISLFSMSTPFAQDVDYPKGPVKLIVPIGAGGGTDIL
jgi:tripartite-type tricarboxylate transporter receptor subunit TctC